MPQRGRPVLAAYGACRTRKSKVSLMCNMFCMCAKMLNVFHHHPGQPITLVSFPWRDQLLLCIFNFIAIKQGTYVRRALI
jgi:hypothetical protein